MKKIKTFLIRSKYGLVIFGIAFVVAIGLLCGTSYALWNLNFTQTNSNVVSTACFDMTFTELSPSVNIQNAYPISDEKGLETTPYTFKVKNTCSQYGSFVVRIDMLSSSTMTSDKIKVQLTGASSISPTVLSTLEENTVLEQGVNSSKIIASGALAEQEEKEYSLRIWIDASAGNEIMNQEFNARITIDTAATIEPCADCSTLRVAENQPSETFKFLNTPGQIAMRRDYIRSIKFVDHTTVPAEAQYSWWDVSAAGDNSVIAWIKIISPGNYEITIGGVGGVKANSNSSWLFRNLRNLDSIDLTHFYTHEVTNMDYMFQYTGYNNASFTLDLGDNFDTSKVTNMDYMFQYTGYSNSPFTLDLGDKFDTSKVTKMVSMFQYTGYNNASFTLDLGNKFDTSSVTNMSNMFGNLGHSNPNFTLDLGDKFDTSNVTNMSSMFQTTGDTSTVFTLDLGDKFDTSNVTNMQSMFSQAGSSSPVFTLDLGDNFDTSSVTNMQSMFVYTGRSNPNFTLDLGDKFDTSNVTNMGSMFSNTGYSNTVFALNFGDKFDTSKVWNMNGMFTNAGYSNPNFILDLRNFNINLVTNGVRAFRTNNSSHKIYASASNISFMSGKDFTGTIINCTTNPTSCPN